MTQRDLFDNSPRPVNQYGVRHTSPVVRRTDPATSQQAAAEIMPKLGKLQQIFVDTLRGERYPRTASEVAAKAVPIAAGDDIRGQLTRRETIRKRAGEIPESIVRVCASRTCSVTGKQAQTYEVIR